MSTELWVLILFLEVITFFTGFAAGLKRSDELLEYWRTEAKFLRNYVRTPEE